MKTTLLTLVALALIPLAHAQERTAAGAMETQVNWNALSTKVNAANTKTDAVNSRVDQVVVCSGKGMLYAPGQTGADSQGCVISKLDPTHVNTLNNLTSNVNNVLACNNAGQIYNANTRSCNAISTRPNCRIQSFDAPLDRSNGRYTCPGDTTTVVSRVSAYGFSCGADGRDPSSCLINHNLCLRIICD